MARATKIVKSNSVGGPEAGVHSFPHLLEHNMYLISNNFQLGIRIKCVIKQDSDLKIIVLYIVLLERKVYILENRGCC